MKEYGNWGKKKCFSCGRESLWKSDFKYSIGEHVKVQCPYCWSQDYHEVVSLGWDEKDEAEYQRSIPKSPFME